MSINIAVLPIAGLGTRFLPFTKVIPKEMLPINGIPILQLLIEEAVEAGVSEIVLVVNHEKEPIIRSYLSHDGGSTAKITEKGKDEKLARLNKLLDSVKFHYVYQEEQLGDGHAILQAEETVAGRPFVVLFGDDLISPDNATKQLLSAYKTTGTSVIALEEIEPDMSESYGIIKPKESKDGSLYEIEDMVEKPKPEDAPSNLGVIGKYVCTPEIFPALHNAEASVGGEIRLIDGFKKLKKSQSLHGLKLTGKRYDTGTLNGYRKAINELQT
jgi:UTP--glucose-1-phosphate uridylyltransferase